MCRVCYSAQYMLMCTGDVCSVLQCRVYFVSRFDIYSVLQCTVYVDVYSSCV